MNNYTTRWLPWLVCILVVTMTVATLVGGAFAPLELEAAIEDDTDSQEVAHIIETESDEPVEMEIVSPLAQTRDNGEVTIEFVRWEEVDGTDSGTDPEWVADPETEYRIVYEATAHSEASDGTYSFEFEAESEDGTTYETTFDVDVSILEPEFGTATADPDPLVFGPDDEDGTSTAVTVGVPNDGDGVLIPESVAVENEPNGFDITVESIPEEIDAQDAKPVQVTVEADDTVDEGAYEFTLTVDDTLGNQLEAPIEIEVLRPPAVETDPNALDLGEILINETETDTVEIREVTDHDDVAELEAVYAAKSQADLDVSDLEGLSISADGSESAEIGVSVGPTAEQGEQLDWTVTLGPEADQAPRTQLTVGAEVIFPPYFGRLSASEAELQFDQPREEITEISDTVRVDVPNDGDQEMDVIDASATIEGESIDAEIQSRPDTIEERSTGELIIVLTADPETLFGTRTLTVTVESEEDGQEELQTDIDIVQFPDVDVSEQTVDLGEIPIGTRESSTVDIEERLGYRDVDDFRLELVDSPEQGWFETLESPSRLDSGDDASLRFRTEFDADAELFRTYEWRYEVSGSNIDGFNIVVSAAPRPVECTEVVNDLETYSGPSDDAESFAHSIAESIRTVEEEARNGGDNTLDDIANACSAGRGALLFLTANEDVLDAEGPDEQQEAAARMAFGFSTAEQNSRAITDEQARSAAVDATETGEQLLDRRISERESTVEEQLDNATVLEEARAKNELARLAGLRGDDTEATEARSTADQAFDRYLTLVSDGNDNLERAREIDEELDDSLFVSVLGQELFWISHLDEFQTERDEMLSEYDTAAENFEEAGAAERAQSTRAERNEAASAYQTALVFSGIAAGIVALLLSFVLYYEAKSIYRYVQDVSAANVGSSLI